MAFLEGQVWLAEQDMILPGKGLLCIHMESPGETCCEQGDIHWQADRQAKKGDEVHVSFPHRLFDGG